MSARRAVRGGGGARRQPRFGRSSDARRSLAQLPASSSSHSSAASSAIVAMLALSAGLLGCSTPGDDPGVALPVDPAAIYAQMCARCHGADGRGDPEIKKTLPVRNFSDPAFLARAGVDEVSRVIMGGKNQMPAFGGLLSAPKIQSLAGYVRRLGRGAVPPPPATAPGAAPAMGAAPLVPPSPVAPLAAPSAPAAPAPAPAAAPAPGPGPAPTAAPAPTPR